MNVFEGECSEKGSHRSAQLTVKQGMPRFFWVLCSRLCMSMVRPLTFPPLTSPSPTGQTPATKALVTHRREKSTHG